MYKRCLGIGLTVLDQRLDWSGWKFLVQLNLQSRFPRYTLKRISKPG